MAKGNSTNKTSNSGRGLGWPSHGLESSTTGLGRSTVTCFVVVIYKKKIKDM